MNLSIKEIKHLFSKVSNLDDDVCFKTSDINIDSRTVQTNQIFITIKGAKFDGNDFIQEVLKINPLFIISETNIDNQIPYALVDSGKQFLIDLAKLVIKKTSSKKIAITGSNGKTTTKNLITHFLTNKVGDKDVAATYGNFNNDIGLPLSIFKIHGNEKYLVLEIGTNHPGEIRWLTDIVRPHIAVITNIGDAHFGNFGSQAEIAKEKKQIFHYHNEEDIKILPDNINFFSELNNSKGKLFVISSDYSNQANRLNYEYVGPNKIKFIYLNQQVVLDSPLEGAHNLQNFIIACAVLINLGFYLDSFEDGFKNFSGTAGRFNKISMKNNIDIIDDSYNSNPTSMSSAIDYISSSLKHKILMIGDMGELGEFSEQYHDQIVRKIEESNIDTILAHGSSITQALSKVKNMKKNIYCFNDIHHLIEKSLKLIKKDTIVLIKASRFMKFDVIASELKERFK
ncbi:MAG: UDP-N-acetylmuramoyl-tripeptide--D-alanyl-D-alanine ligase [Proteobacteria bacterium]|nr:UDP-N-acetylmuramoyl-tripeptide--D-alanyl-D-alanine ligase [Pseudomonadota bacterium]